VPVLFRFFELEFKTHVKPVVDSIVDKDLKDALSASANEFLRHSVFVSYPAVSMSAVIHSSQVFKQITEYGYLLILLGLFSKLSRKMILRVK
jgi:hypothetical protein